MSRKWWVTPPIHMSQYLFSHRVWWVTPPIHIYLMCNTQTHMFHYLFSRAMIHDRSTPHTLCRTHPTITRWGGSWVTGRAFVSFAAALRAHPPSHYLKCRWAHVWVMSQTNESCHTWMSHALYQWSLVWVMSQTNETCHTSKSDALYKWRVFMLFS